MRCSCLRRGELECPLFVALSIHRYPTRLSLVSARCASGCTCRTQCRGGRSSIGRIGGVEGLRAVLLAIVGAGSRGSLGRSGR